MPNEPTNRPRTPINERALLTVNDATDYLSISRTRLDEYRACGDIKPIELGSRNLRYRRRDLDELIEKIASKDTHFDRMTRRE